MKRIFLGLFVIAFALISFLSARAQSSPEVSVVEAEVADMQQEMVAISFTLAANSDITERQIQAKVEVLDTEGVLAETSQEVTIQPGERLEVATVSLTRGPVSAPMVRITLEDAQTGVLDTYEEAFPAIGAQLVLQAVAEENTTATLTPSEPESPGLRLVPLMLVGAATVLVMGILVLWVMVRRRRRRPMMPPTPPGTFVLVFIGALAVFLLSHQPPTHQVSAQGTSSDLVILAAGPSSYPRGLEVTYNVIVANNSSAAARNVVLTDQFSVAGQFVKAEGASCALGGNNVVCVLGTLAPRAQQAINLTFRTPESLACGTTVRNIAWVNGSTADLNPGNNTSGFVSTTLTCGGGAGATDVAIVKQGPATIQSNDRLLYNVLVANNSAQATADNVEVTDTFDARLTFLGATPDICSASGNVVTCQIGTMTPVTQQAINLEFQATACNATVTDTARVTSSLGNDDVPANNQDNASTQIVGDEACPTPPPPSNNACTVVHGWTHGWWWGSSIGVPNAPVVQQWGGDPNGTGYYAVKPSNLPAHVEYRELNLFANELKPSDLEGVDLFVMSDADTEHNGKSVGNNRLSWEEVGIFEDFWRQGMDIIAVADNPGPDNAAQGTVDLLNYNGISDFLHYNETFSLANNLDNSGVVNPPAGLFPFLQGVQFNFSRADGGTDSPGWIDKVANGASCVVDHNGKCRVAYLPEADDHGYVFVSGNAWTGSGQYIRNLIEESCATPEEPPVVPPTTPQCSDGIDNEDPEDTLADADDPGCWEDADDPSTYNPGDSNERDDDTNPTAQCSDGADNDGDGFIDEVDPGCHTDNDPQNADSYDPDDDDEQHTPGFRPGPIRIVE